MVLDSSAVLAILLNEPEAERMEEAIAADSTRLLSAANALEVAIVVETKFGEAGASEFNNLIQAAGIQLVSATAEQFAIARKAYERYGRGRHFARLNYGDCFAYALAIVSGEPLLFTGDHFLRTDVPVYRGQDQTEGG